MFEEHLYKEQLLNAIGTDPQIVDSVKTHLRQKLVTKLRNATVNVPSKIELGSAGDTLIQKICCSLFANYLESRRLFHTLSVFSPECGFSRVFFDPKELTSLLHMSPTDTGESVIETLLKEQMPRGRLYEKTTEAAAQTDDRDLVNGLESKLAEIEFSYKQKLYLTARPIQETEARMQKHKNELSKRYKQQLDAEVERIRAFELSQVRLDEQRKFQVKLKEVTEELEVQHLQKLQRLRKRQSDVIKKVTAKMKEVETYNYQARQRILHDMESLKDREQELIRAKEALEARQRSLVTTTKL